MTTALAVLGYIVYAGLALTFCRVCVWFSFNGGWNAKRALVALVPFAAFLGLQGFLPSLLIAQIVAVGVVVVNTLLVRYVDYPRELARKA